MVWRDKSVDMPRLVKVRERWRLTAKRDRESVWERVDEVVQLHSVAWQAYAGKNWERVCECNERALSHQSAFPSTAARCRELVKTVPFPALFTHLSEIEARRRSQPQKDFLFYAVYYCNALSLIFTALVSIYIRCSMSAITCAYAYSCNRV